MRVIAHPYSSRLSKMRVLGQEIKRNYQLYLLILPVIGYFLIFHYGPMYGVQIAFRNYSVRRGIWGSNWIGFEHFRAFFSSYYFGTVLSNTLLISLYTLLAGFPAPIFLALFLNEVTYKPFKKTVQTVTYAPHFISTVVMTSMIILFLSPQAGFVNKFIEMLGRKPVYFLGIESMFKSVYVLSGVWQSTGWGSIIYMAALAGIDPQLHEAAVMDGAGRLRRIWHINIPGILPTAVILLIMNSGQLMNVGFEKIYLLQNDLNRSASEVISTLVYQQGLIKMNYSYSTAVGLFNSVINCMLLLTVNQIARRVGETSLW